jgi:aryl-alcohol dehydrogenase-like predicted oxidoreductase
MTFGKEWNWGATRKESQKIFSAYAAAGGNFIDTANRYTEGTSEKFVGDFIRSDRDHFVLATKYSLFMRRDDPSFSGNHRKNMMQSVEASLQRLGTEYIDLYWVHAWDFSTPVDEVMRGLDDLVTQGKVHYIGISDTPAWIVSQANTLAEFRGWSRFVGLQLRYSLLDRAAERDLLPMAASLGLGVTPWSVLGAGVLTGKYNSKKPPTEGRAKGGGAETLERNLTIAQTCIEIGKENGCSPSQVAIRWVMQQPLTVVPLIGARTVKQLEDNLGVLKVTLSDEQMVRLNEVSRIERGFPHDFLESERVRDLLFGGTYDKIDL